VKFRLTAKALADGLPGTVSEARKDRSMLVYTEKAGRDGVGTPGGKVPSDDLGMHYLVTHGYAIETTAAPAASTETQAPEPVADSTMLSAPADGMVRPRGKK
jgi:hypothetical protein